MMEAREHLLYVLWDREGDGTVGIIPVKANSVILPSFPIDGESVVLLEVFHEEVDIVFDFVLYTEIVDH